MSSKPKKLVVAENIWTPANVVTVLRICLVPVFVAAFLMPWPEWLGWTFISEQTKALIAAGLFILISCTDWIDGYLARSRGEVTDFGKFVDPLADKILVAAALLALVELQVLPSWPVLIILVREFIVSGVRMLAASEGVVIAASWYGKAKTVFQIVAIVMFIVKDNLPLDILTFDDAIGSTFFVASWIVMAIALILTVISMMDYLSKARHLIGFAPKDGVSNISEKSLKRSTLAISREIIIEGTKSGARIGTAESITGGLICSSLTDISGSSAVVYGGINAYDNSVKENMLKVSGELISEQGAVCEQVAKDMATGACEALGLTHSVAVTGIAGPTGGSEDKPVGTVWIAVCNKGAVEAKLHHFEGDREIIRLQTTVAALEMLLDAINEEA